MRGSSEAYSPQPQSPPTPTPTSPPTSPPTQPALQVIGKPDEDCVEAFESALTRGEKPALRLFLPEADAPEYLDTLCELIRVELDLRSRKGEPWDLDTYRAEFPELFVSDSHRQLVEWESQRLKIQEKSTPRPKTPEKAKAKAPGFPPQRLSPQSQPQPSPFEPKNRVPENRVPQDLPRIDSPQPSTYVTEATDSPTVTHHAVLQAADAFRKRMSNANANANAFPATTGSGSTYVHDEGEGGEDVNTLISMLVRLARNDPQEADRLAASLLALPTLEMGVSFQGFQLIRELGRGAMGRVFLARQEELAGREIVLKVSPDIHGESQALAQLSHPNVVPIYSIHRDGQFQAVCMPYLGDVTLEALLVARGRGEPPPAGFHANAILPGDPEDLYANLVMMRGLTEGLAHAHNNKIIHRDLKPANILLGRDGRAILLDFNLAADLKNLDPASAYLGGTLPYMAPEQLEAFASQRPSEAPPETADIFALGVILYRCLTGQLPYPGRTGPLDRMLPLLIDDRLKLPAPPSQLRPGLPEEVDAFVRKCLEPIPADRFDTADNVLNALTPLLVRAAPAGVGVGVTAPPLPRWRVWGTRALIAALTIVSIGLLAFTVRDRMRPRDLSPSGAAPAKVPSAAELLKAARESYLLALGSRMGVIVSEPELQEKWSQSAAVFRAHGAFPAEPLLPGPDSLANISVPKRNELHELAYLTAQWSLRQGRLQQIHRESTQSHGAPAKNAENAKNADSHAAPTLDEYWEAARFWNRWALSFAKPNLLSPRAAYRQRALIEHFAGRIKEAREAELQGESSPPDDNPARVAVLELIANLEDNQLEPAMKVLNKLTETQGESPAIWLLLGNVHASMGLVAEAKSCYDNAIRLAPDLPWARFHLGLLYLTTHRHEEAEQTFTTVLDSDPGNTPARVNRALARMDLEQYNRVLEDLDAVVQSPGVHPSRVHFLRAEAYEKLGDAAAADLARDLGRTTPPTDATDAVARAAQWQKDGNADAALTDLDLALSLEPGMTEALHGKASLLAAMGKTQPAIELLSEVLLHNPKYVASVSGRGVLWARVKSWDNALRDAQTAVALNQGRDPFITYQSACIHALTVPVRPDEFSKALRLLADAFQRDPQWVTVAGDDTDLDPIRDRPEFQALLKNPLTPISSPSPSPSP